MWKYVNWQEGLFPICLLTVMEWGSLRLAGAPSCKPWSRGTVAGWFVSTEQRAPGEATPGLTLVFVARLISLCFKTSQPQVLSNFIFCRLYYFSEHVAFSLRCSSRPPGSTSHCKSLLPDPVPGGHWAPGPGFRVQGGSSHLSDICDRPDSFLVWDVGEMVTLLFIRGDDSLDEPSPCSNEGT